MCECVLESSRFITENVARLNYITMKKKGKRKRSNFFFFFGYYKNIFGLIFSFYNTSHKLEFFFSTFYRNFHYPTSFSWIKEDIVLSDSL
jgi:hypothetical protein